MGVKTHVCSVIMSALLFVACQTTTNTPPAPVHNRTTPCQAACANMRAHVCPEGNPIDMNTSCNVDADCKGPNGRQDVNQKCAANGQCMITCEAFCNATQEAGVGLDPTCVAQAWSCDAINECGTVASGTSCKGPGCKVSPGGK